MAVNITAIRQLGGAEKFPISPFDIQSGNNLSPVALDLSGLQRRSSRIKSFFENSQQISISGQQVSKVSLKVNEKSISLRQVKTDEGRRSVRIANDNVKFSREGIPIFFNVVYEEKPDEYATFSGNMKPLS